MIREATSKDYFAILALAEKFWQDTEYDEDFDPAHVLDYIKLAGNCGLLAVVDVDGKVVGFIAGVVSPLLGNRNALIAAELAYYVEPEYRGRGVRLLSFYERLVKAKGIKYNSMMSLQSSKPEAANEIYRRFGYHHTETTFLKVM